jgi:hypothetical protein
METGTQTDYFYDILQSLALIHSELAQIRELLERVLPPKDKQVALGKF